MAEEVTKVVENIDKLFSEIVVNGESHVSDRYIPPEPAQSNPPASTNQEEPQQTQPAQTVQGQYVKAVDLNNVLHDFKDEDLGTVVERIGSLIPSEASSSNKLTDKHYVDTEVSDAINDLDVSEVGGNGKYIKSIKQVDGKIEAEEDFISGSGVAFVGTRAQYETAKLIPLGQSGHIPSGSLVIITDEDSYIEGEDR